MLYRIPRQAYFVEPPLAREIGHLIHQPVCPSNAQGSSRSRLARALFAAVLWLPAAAFASVPTGEIAVFGISMEFILFALTLLGVAVLHNYTLAVALTGLVCITGYKLGFTGFHTGSGLQGLAAHLEHEWVILANLLGLLLGFALLARHFEDSGAPKLLPRYLPDGPLGALALLVVIFMLSGFLDNIAATLIGGTIAATVFHHRVHIGYLAAIVAAANAGGAGSVLGDTTTTMMWISGISPFDVIDAYIAGAVALVIFGIPAAMQQHAFSPIRHEVPADAHIDWPRLWIVAAILAAAVTTNIVVNSSFKSLADSFPFLGAAVWVAILLAARTRQPEWRLLPNAFKGSLFLLTLVICASMMPVEKLPEASWYSALTLGFVSAAFDNIPLTALAIEQGGFDWGLLAFAVGFGGSMIWFGSSAGVALSSMYPQAKSVGNWLRHGWHIPIAYIGGFTALYLLLGWQPLVPHLDVDSSTGTAEPIQSVVGLPDASQRLGMSIQLAREEAF